MAVEHFLSPSDQQKMIQNTQTKSILLLKDKDLKSEKNTRCRWEPAQKRKGSVAARLGNKNSEQNLLCFSCLVQMPLKEPLSYFIDNWSSAITTVPSYVFLLSLEINLLLQYLAWNSSFILLILGFSLQLFWTVLAQVPGSEEAHKTLIYLSKALKHLILR